MWKAFELPFELYAVAFAPRRCADNLRRPSTDGWIGLIGYRLRRYSAILGL